MYKLSHSTWLSFLYFICTQSPYKCGFHVIIRARQLKPRKDLEEPWFQWQWTLNCPGSMLGTLSLNWYHSALTGNLWWEWGFPLPFCSKTLQEYFFIVDLVKCCWNTLATFFLTVVNNWTSLSANLAMKYKCTKTVWEESNECCHWNTYFGSENTTKLCHKRWSLCRSE